LKAILIYCERFGAWATSLRQQAGLSALPQRETRSLGECQESLVENPASLVVLEVTPTNLEKAFEWLARQPQDFPQSRTLVVAQRGLEPYEWDARELGCLAFTTSPRALAPVARLIEQYFAMLPRTEMSVEEQVWSRLPWTR
jgi:hypothetical protein